MKATFLKTHSEVVVTIGLNKSTLIDFNRKRIEYIPNSMAEFIQESCSKNKSIESIKKTYSNDEKETIDEYVNYLLENEFAFFTKFPVRFPQSDKKYYSPSIISNAIIDIRNHSNFQFEQICSDLDELNCFHLELRFFDCYSLEKINQILTYFIGSKLRSIHILIQYQIEIHDSNLHFLFKKNPKLTKIIVSDSVKNEINNQFGYYVEHTTNIIKNENHCGFVHSKYFSLDLPSYLHNLKYNSCLNAKISIDSEGKIKNCPAMDLDYGNIANTSLIDVANNTDFKRLWEIKKDDISVCKSCELRYICSDCRAFTVNGEFYSKPKHCNYEP